MATHTASPEAAKRGHRKFEKERTKQLNIRLNDRTDSDIIEYLESIENKRSYLLGLIRADMAKNNPAE